MPPIYPDQGQQAPSPAGPGAGPQGQPFAAIAPTRPDDLMRKLQIVAGLEKAPPVPPERKVATQLWGQAIALLMQCAQNDVTFAGIIYEEVPRLAQRLAAASVPKGPDIDMMGGPENYLNPGGAPSNVIPSAAPMGPMMPDMGF